VVRISPFMKVWKRMDDVTAVKNIVAKDEIDIAGCWPPARFAPSPHCDDRPPGEIPHLIVIHAISLPPGHFGGDDVEKLFTGCLDPDAHPYYKDIGHLRVSAHFFIRRDGQVVQFVSCHQRAWHAGLSSWQGKNRCNDFSIGIELEGCDDQPFTEDQYAQLRRLIHVLQHQWPIQDIVGHSDIAPGRKTDPGPCFDWSRLQEDISCKRM